MGSATVVNDLDAAYLGDDRRVLIRRFGTLRSDMLFVYGARSMSRLSRNVMMASDSTSDSLGGLNDVSFATRVSVSQSSFCEMWSGLSAAWCNNGYWAVTKLCHHSVGLLLDTQMNIELVQRTPAPPFITVATSRVKHGQKMQVRKANCLWRKVAETELNTMQSQPNDQSAEYASV